MWDIHSRSAVRPPPVNMRRLGLSWVLSLLLVFVQQGALLHEISHLQQSLQRAGETLRADTGRTGNAPCLTCEAFSQAASPALGGSPPITPSSAVFLPTIYASHTAAGVEVPTPRSRGPPQV